MQRKEGRMRREAELEGGSYKSSSPRDCWKPPETRKD